MSFFARTRFGGDKRDRTADLLNAIQALSRVTSEASQIDQNHIENKK